MNLPISDEQVLSIARSALRDLPGDGPSLPIEPLLEIGSRTSYQRQGEGKALVYRVEVLVEPSTRDGQRCSIAALNFLFDENGRLLEPRQIADTRNE